MHLKAYQTRSHLPETDGHVWIHWTILSHTGTVVPVCDKMVQWIRTTLKVKAKAWNSTPHHPKMPEPMTTNTKICMGDYVPDIYPCAKCHYDPIWGFCPHICEVAYQIFTRLIFLVLPTRYRPGRCTDFNDQYVKRRRFVQGCAFRGSQEQFFTSWPHFRQKNANFWSTFDGTLKI